MRANANDGAISDKNMSSISVVTVNDETAPIGESSPLINDLQQSALPPRRYGPRHSVSWVIFSKKGTLDG